MCVCVCVCVCVFVRYLSDRSTVFDRVTKLANDKRNI